MSGRVPCRHAISKSDMVENVGVDVGIASPSVSLQKLLPVSTSGFVADIVGFWCRQMSDNVDSVIIGSGMVENVG